MDLCIIEINIFQVLLNFTIEINFKENSKFNLNMSILIKGEFLWPKDTKYAFPEICLLVVISTWLLQQLTVE